MRATFTNKSVVIPRVRSHDNFFAYGIQQKNPGNPNRL